MVSVDYKELVLSHVRNCFVTSDDHGFCELLFSRQVDWNPEGIGDVLNENFVLPLIDTDADDFSRFSPECPYVESKYVLRTSGHPSSYAVESNDPIPTAKQSCRIKSLTNADIDYYFPVKTVSSSLSSSKSSKKSCLTLALEQAQADGQLARSSLFADYCIYDGRPAGSVSPVRSGHMDITDRRFVVWLWRVPHFPRASLNLQPRLGTTVRQFVGLAFWQYFNDVSRSDIPSELFSNLDRFDSTFLDRISVYIMDTPEDDVDSDFPPLDPKDPIHKYDFDSLALIEQQISRVEETKNKEVPLLLVTIHMTQGISTFRFPADTTLHAVLERAARRRQLPQHGGYEYYLESWPHATDLRGQQLQSGQSAITRRSLGDSSQLREGQRLDLSLRLMDIVSAQLPLKFVLARDHSRCDPAMVDSGDEDEQKAASSAVGNSSAELHAALQLRQYRVTLLRNGVFPREVQLNVSKDGLKIEQVAPSFRRPKLFSKFKPILLSVDMVADCELVSPISQPHREEQRSTRSQCTKSDESQYARAFSTGKVQFRIIHVAKTGENSAYPSSNLTQRPSVVDGEMNGTLDSSTVFPQFNALCFETQWTRARAICDQVTMILECCESKARHLYVRRRLSTT